MASGGASGKGLVLRGGASPKRVAARGNEWTPRMAEQFVETLAETCNVTLAAKAIGRSVANVYRRRAKDASFRANWDQALAIGYSRLEMMLLERALHGVEKVVVAKDGTSSVMREYPDRVALTLLRMHRERVTNSEQPIDEQEYVEARDRILARIKRIRVQKGIKVKGMATIEALRRCARGRSKRAL